jgi:hypothetical protein
MAAPNYIKTGEYTIGNMGQSGLSFNMSRLSGTTIINGVTYAAGKKSAVNGRTHRRLFFA